MLSLALLPLAGYFIWLAFLNVQRRPTVVSGVSDFMFLVCGLFGMITLGPGRLLIPMDVLAFWGLTVWLFWAAFYFAVAHLIARLLERRIVVYHCSLTNFVPKLIELGRELDPQARFEGNVFFLPGFGIQCSVVASGFGLLVLTATGPSQDETKWRHFERVLAINCRNLQCSTKSGLILWSVFSLILFVLIAFSALEYPAWLESIYGYWG